MEEGGGGVARARERQEGTKGGLPHRWGACKRRGMYATRLSRLVGPAGGTRDPGPTQVPLGPWRTRRAFRRFRGAQKHVHS